MENLNDLSIKQIFQIKINDQSTFEDVLSNYDISRNQRGHIIKDENYHIMKRELIKEIQSARNKREEQLEQIPTPIEPTKPYQPPPTINPYKLTFDDVEQMKDNTKDLLSPVNTDYKDIQLEQARKTIIEKQKEIEELKAQNKKLIIEGIKSRIHPTPANSDIPLPPPPPEKLPEQALYDLPVYGESEEFKRRHHNLSFDEYRESVKKQKQLIPELKNYLNEDREVYEFDFSKINNFGKGELQEALLNQFQNKISKLSITNKYKITYRVGNEWRSAPLKIVYEKLLNNLQEGHLIYNIDEAPTWTYEAGTKKYELPEWSLFDYIRIEKLFKYKKVNRDNGGHFFEYLAVESLPKRVIEYLAKLQIFTCLSINGKTQRKELDDCCFIYAVKQTGKFTEE